MKHTIKNPVYPLLLNLIVDHADMRREYLQDVSSDHLTFDRSQPFPRLGQNVGFMGKSWTVDHVREQEPPEGNDVLKWFVLTERRG